MKSVGERIQQARLARGMTAAALAAEVGYKTQSGIANLENRSNGNGGNKITAIAHVLQVPKTWLQDGPDSDTVPFLSTNGMQDFQLGTAVRSNDAVWPFPHIDPARFDRVMAMLGPARAGIAMQELERHALAIIEHWEREVGLGNRRAA